MEPTNEKVDEKQNALLAAAMAFVQIANDYPNNSSLLDVLKFDSKTGYSVDVEHLIRCTTEKLYNQKIDFEIYVPGSLEPDTRKPEFQPNANSEKTDYEHKVAMQSLALKPIAK